MEITFNKDWRNIAISMSGGADSALLAYMICELAKEHNITIHIINHVRCWKTKPWQQHDADRVYNWLFQRFYHTTFKRHTNFIAPELEYGNIGPSLVDEYGKQVSGDNIEIRAFAEYVCFKENVDAYFNGVTRNPKGIDLGGMTSRDIDPSPSNRHLAEMEHMGKMVYHPFRFIDKSEIVKKYKELDIMELFELTRSCEGVFNSVNYESYTPGQHVPVCGECFWCKEREWAIESTKSAK
jgi:hypothetical protein